MARRLLLLLPLVMCCTRQQNLHRPIELAELALEVSQTSREVGYTNKEAGFFYTETSGPRRSGWQGWHVYTHKILDDYALLLDRERLGRDAVHRATVFPHRLVREYTSGIVETFTFLDSLNAFVIELTGLRRGAVSWHPLYGDATSANDFRIVERDSSLLIAHARDLEEGKVRQHPVWIGVRIAGTGTVVKGTADTIVDGNLFSPAGLQFSTSGPTATLCVAAGRTEGETAALLGTVASGWTDLIARRLERMEHLLNDSYVRTDNPRFDKALHWAMISMDAVVMNQGKKGIFAGLPWFHNYWGRDSFISLPGATLATGRFEEAKEILLSFADWQDRNPASPTFGRIPNLVDPSSISYNTADGTPWFVVALGEYVRYSGDVELGRSLFPVVRRSVEGAWKRYTDGNGFLTHGDAETWMDAVGTQGPWSPRGDRANDIQALWYRQLMTAAWLARLSGQTSFAERCEENAANVSNAFHRMFIDSGRTLVYDHLNRDNTPDVQIRPNQFFVFDLLREDEELTRSLFEAATRRLVYPHGVASLSQEDSSFHPYHHHLPYYVQDAAYHNGIVWTWLAGPWIREAVRQGQQDGAFRVTETMMGQILECGAAGTLSELLDAAAHPVEKAPRLSGTFTQAWSLAEFIRSFYQDYLGATIDLPGGLVQLQPRLPSAIRQVEAKVRAGDATLVVSVRASESDAHLDIAVPEQCPVNTLRVDWILAGGTRYQFNAALNAGSCTFSMADRIVTRSADSGSAPPVAAVTDISQPPPLELAVPTIHTDLPSLREPSHRMLRNEEIKEANAHADVLAHTADPEGDDVGTGKYTYPTTPHLKPGSLDLTRFILCGDEKNVYFTLGFRNLSNPGWHPEYGFQLTYAAITLRTSDEPKGKGRSVGMNSNVAVPEQYAFDRIVYVGGGIRVTDAAGTVLAEYLPQPGDERSPLGHTGTRTIDFAIPRKLLGLVDSNWAFAVFTGAQDDHGGAGVGEFRTVGEEAGEWIGGGKRKPSEANVYDSLFGKTHRPSSTTSFMK